ncbi:MAG: DJ-1/PfpI family protein [Armatimonadota bacterium]
MTQRLRGKTVLFLLVNGFESDCYTQLRDCLLSWGAALAIAGAAEGDTMISADGRVQVESDLVFAHAVQQAYDAVIVADSITGQAVRDDPAAVSLLRAYRERGSVVVTVGGGAHALVGAGIASNSTVASIPELEDALADTGASAAATSIAINENLLTARPDADMLLFCDDIANFMVAGQAKAA